MQNTLPMIGCGFRLEVRKDILDNLFAFDILELMVDHYLAAGFKTRQLFKAVAKERPVILHGVGLSIGCANEPDLTYLSKVASAIDELHPIAYGEHLAFTKALNIETAHLLPLPRNQNTVEILLNNIQIVKKYISAPFMLENVAYYYDYPDSIIPEVDFLNRICLESDISILLDIENLRINACNNSYNPYDFINHLITDRVKCIHVAGGKQSKNLQLDTHDQVLSEEVYKLLTFALKKTHPDCIILERDGRLEYFNEIVSDCLKIKLLVCEKNEENHANQ